MSVFLLGLPGYAGGQTAANPVPADGARYVDPEVELRWPRSLDVSAYYVYFGENSADVNDGTGGTFQGSQTKTSFVVGSPGHPYPDGLVPGTTYYWRIDAVVAGRATTIHKGDVWSFTVAPNTAHDPSPADGGKSANLNVVLSWEKGVGAEWHDIYFGENFADVDAGTGGTYKLSMRATGSIYITGPLQVGKVYYWRVDEIEADGTIHKGDVWSFTAGAQVWAFPDAEGWAASTPGGRGGKIIRVINLNADGSGSFAAAVAASGPRIVVFEVGGVIDLKGTTISIGEPYLTVAGQTAPSPGITFIDGSIRISKTHDIVIQHIRVRPGASRHSKGWEPDGISLNSAYYVILDHCSVSWAVDENMSASGPRFEGSSPDDWRSNTSHTVTFSNNIIAEGLSYATHQKGEHSKGSLIHDNASEIAIVKNLYASNVRRNPYFKGGARGVVVNNYIYNPGRRAMHYNLPSSEWQGYSYETGKMTVIGNVLQYGPNTSSLSLLDVDNGPAEIYLLDNMAKDQSGRNVDVYRGSTFKLVNRKPVWIDNLQLIPSSDVRDYIVQNAGARPWDRDAIDTRIINEMLRGTGQIIDFETEVGGYPDHQPTYAPFNEEEWDLSTMIRITPGEVEPTDSRLEDFETGDFRRLPWEHAGNENWAVTSRLKHTGAYSAKAGAIEDNGNTTLQVTLDCSDGDVAFYCKVSSESGYDYLKFYIDRVKQGEWSGEQDWAEVSFPVAAGTRTFEWTYSKDGSSSDRDDTAWIDDIAFPIE